MIEWGKVNRKKKSTESNFTKRMKKIGIWLEILKEEQRISYRELSNVENCLGIKESNIEKCVESHYKNWRGLCKDCLVY